MRPGTTDASRRTRGDAAGVPFRTIKRGYEMAPCDFETGSPPLGRYVDFPPYLNEPHLRLAIEGYPATSVAIILSKR